MKPVAARVAAYARRAVATVRAATFAAPPRSSIVVFDREAADVVGRMILRDIPYAVFEARGERYYLSPRVLARAARRLPGVRRAVRPGELPSGARGMVEVLWRTYVLACLELMRPVVVLTFVDNNATFQWASRNLPGPTFIAVQNGSRFRPSVRDWLPTPPRAGSVISMPHLYCFSNYEPELYAAYGHRVDAFHVVGSVRADYYRAAIAPGRASRAHYDLCVVSEWEPSLFSPDTPFPAVAAGLARLYDFLGRFVASSEWSVAVALRSAVPGEAAFFARLFGSRAALIPSDPAAMSTYAAMDDSQVVVALNSTAAREAFGWGRSVLFGNFTGDQGYGPPRADPLWLVEASDYAEFAAALERLLAMPPREFVERARWAAPYMMHHDPRRPAHEAVAAHVRACVARAAA